MLEKYKIENNNLLNVAVCTIAKNENAYIRDFVTYYFNIGVSKIYIYDNNDTDGERLDEKILDFIIQGKISLIDYRGKKVCQLNAYQDFCDKYLSLHDWTCFFDVDEFLVINSGMSLPEFLSEDRYNEADIIHINFKTYGDNNLLHYQNIPIYERLSTPIETYAFGPLLYPVNFHIKSIIKNMRKNIYWSGDSHSPDIHDGICVNESGERVECNQSVSSISYNYAYISHYSTKTISEFLNCKFKRGFPDQEKKVDERTMHDDISKFFSFNQVASDKLKICDEFTRKNFNNISHPGRIIVQLHGEISQIICNMTFGIYLNQKYGGELIFYTDARYPDALDMTKWHDIQHTFLSSIQDIVCTLSRAVLDDVKQYIKLDILDKIPDIETTANTPIYFYGIFKNIYILKDYAKKIYTMNESLANHDMGIQLHHCVCIIITNQDYDDIKWYKNKLENIHKNEKTIIVTDVPNKCMHEFNESIYPLQSFLSILPAINSTKFANTLIIGKSALGYACAIISNAEKIYARDTVIKGIKMPRISEWIYS